MTSNTPNRFLIYCFFIGFVDALIDFTIWEIAFSTARVDAEKGGCGISQSLSSNERVIDWGEPGTAGNNFVMGETFRRSTPITYIGRFPWELIDC